MSGPRSHRVIELDADARATLEQVTRRTTESVGLVRRVRIVLLVADGLPLDQVAREVGVRPNVVRTWADRYRAGGLAALQDRPRSGRPRTFSPGGRLAPGAAGLRNARAGRAVAQPVGLCGAGAAAHSR